ncbi:MAG: GMC family oxidoreductase [Chitinophagales bacterium]|jgi:choline dehydrogenase-like flavoprotein|nr:GMC family oxidoreductase [Chitinophagales bacterium]
MILDSQTLPEDYHTTADAVIIGSGAGGAPMAYKLAQAGWKVILLEEGRNNNPALFNRDSWGAMKEMYRDSGMLTTLGTPSIPLPLGITLGGTTVINSGTCFRTPEKMFAEWKNKFGLTGLEYGHLLPYFEEAENMIHARQAPYELLGSNNQLFAEGAGKLGMHGRPLTRNAIDCKGAGICVFGCPEGAKQSMEKNFLPAASELGATIITSARVEKIITENKTSKGIEGSFLDAKRKRRTKFRIDAPVVVVSCGAIYTPHLLLRNRLANRSGQVGRNLHIHPAAKVMALFDEEINAWSGVPQGYYVDDYADEGIMFEGFFLPPAILSFALPAMGMRLKQYMADYRKMAGFGIMVTDTSHGRVIKGLNRAPLIFYNLNETDTGKFVKGIEIAARVYFAAGAKKVLLPIHGFGEVTGEEDLQKLRNAKVKPADLELSAFHPMGTCRMGDDDKNSVVNSHLETHDVKGLFVADASVFPSSLGVNPQISIMAFSLLAANYLIKNKGLYSA